MKKDVAIVLLFIFLLNFISFIPFVSADSFSMGYIGSGDGTIMLSSGVEEEMPASEIQQTPILNFDADLLLCLIPNTSFPFSIWISIDCLKKLIDVWN